MQTAEKEPSSFTFRVWGLGFRGFRGLGVWGFRGLGFRVQGLGLKVYLDFKVCRIIALYELWAIILLTFGRVYGFRVKGYRLGDTLPLCQGIYSKKDPKP